MRSLSRRETEVKAAWMEDRHEAYHFSGSRLRIITFASG